METCRAVAVQSPVAGRAFGWLPCYSVVWEVSDCCSESYFNLSDCFSKPYKCIMVLIRSPVRLRRSPLLSFQCRNSKYNMAGGKVEDLQARFKSLCYLVTFFALMLNRKPHLMWKFCLHVTLAFCVLPNACSSPLMFLFPFSTVQVLLLRIHFDL